MGRLLNYLCVMQLIYQVHEIQKTATEIWNELNDRRVFAFHGGMGAGKTTLIQAICREIGVEGTMSSPTFSIINEYHSPQGPVYHIDLYRCTTEEEVLRAGVEDCLYSNNLCFVEWPSIATTVFPPDTVEITIEEINNNTRKINVNRKL